MTGASDYTSSKKEAHSFPVSGDGVRSGRLEKIAACSPTVMAEVST